MIHKRDQEMREKFNITVQNRHQASEEKEEARSSEVDRYFEVMRKVFMNTAETVSADLGKRKSRDLVKSLGTSSMNVNALTRRF